MEPKAGIGGRPFLMVSVALAGVIGGLTIGLLLKIPCRVGGPKGVESAGCLLWQLTQFCWKIASPRLALAFKTGLAVSAKPITAPATTRIPNPKSPRPITILPLPPESIPL